MKKWCLAISIGMIIFLGKPGMQAQGRESDRPIKGHVYGVFEVEDSGDLRSKMINAGFKEVASNRLAKFGLGEHAKNNYRYFLIPLRNMIIQAGEVMARTNWDGSFSMLNVAKGYPFDKWSVKPATLDEPVEDELVGFVKRGNSYFAYMFFSSDEMEKSMHLFNNDERSRKAVAHKHVNNCRHCVKIPDCAINLAAGVSWCIYEHKKKPPADDPKRFCNGEPKKYLNGDGYNCSYFLGRKQCR